MMFFSMFFNWLLVVSLVCFGWIVKVIVLLFGVVVVSCWLFVRCMLLVLVWFSRKLVLLMKLVIVWFSGVL